MNFIHPSRRASNLKNQKTQESTMNRSFKPLLTALMLCVSSLAGAQTWPTKPVRVLVGLAAGGGTDLIARIFTPRLAEALGQPVIVENRPGGGSILAIELTTRAAPDGYTLLFAPVGSIVMNPTIYRNLSYAPLRDLTPISLAVTFPLIVSINANLPAKSVSELVTWLKANPGKANCGGTSQTFQMAISLLTSRTGTDCTFIQYKGNNETAQALMTGDLHFALVDTGPIFPAIKGGKVRGIAVTTPARDATFPDIPTVIEAGFPDLEMRFWMGLFAPAKTPAAITKRLETEMQRIVKTPEAIQQMHSRQVTPSGMGSEEFTKFIAAEMNRWDGIRKAAKIPQIEQ
jgi:tripartite-type tricarboxylate transporter receptor subunit TctC